MKYLDQKKRCEFCYGSVKAPSEITLRYHDTRWGKAEHRDDELFAMLILEGMQAGLSWNLVLEKESEIRLAFDGLRPKTVACFGEEKIESLIRNEKIIRCRRKIVAAVENARAFLKVQSEFHSFDEFIWSFTGGTQIDHRLTRVEDMPSRCLLSEKISKELKKRGFKFVGPTIVYSYLQAIGVINDHAVDCDFR